jgi:hypothetical protein
MSTIPLILSVCTSLNALAAASRQAWSLARDQALPFSSWFRKVRFVSYINKADIHHIDFVPDYHYRHSHSAELYHVLSFDNGHHRSHQYRRKSKLDFACAAAQGN